MLIYYVSFPLYVIYATVIHLIQEIIVKISKVAQQPKTFLFMVFIIN